MGVGGRGWLSEGTPCEPGDGGEHAEPPEGAGDVGDLRIVEHKIPLSEENLPVAVTGPDKKKRAGAGVGHVGADVEKVFKEPEGAEGGTSGFSAEEKIDGTHKRHDEFEQCAAEDHERVAEAGFRATAENAEKRVAGFVNGEIRVIEEEEAGAVVCGVKKEEEIEREGDDGDGAGDGSPVVEGDSAPLHGMRVARARVRFCGFAGDVSSAWQVLCSVECVLR